MGKASRIQRSRIGSTLVVDAGTHSLVLSTVVMIAVSTDGPTGYLVSPPPLLPQNIHSHEKAPADHGDCCGIAHRLLLATAGPIATTPGAGMGWRKSGQTRKRARIRTRVLEGGGQAVEMSCRQAAPFRH